MGIRTPKLLCICFPLLLFFGCKTKNKEKITTHKRVIEDPPLLSMNLEDQDVYNRVYERALLFGDSKAYHRLFGFEYGKNYRFDKVLYFSFIYANRYHYGDAYYHMWAGLTGEKGIDSLDDGIKYFALYCLAKSQELGCTRSAYSIDEYIDECKCDLMSSRYYLSKLADLK